MPFLFAERSNITPPTIICSASTLTLTQVCLNSLSSLNQQSMRIPCCSPALCLTTLTLTAGAQYTFSLPARNGLSEYIYPL